VASYSAPVLDRGNPKVGGGVQFQEVHVRK